MRGIPLLAAVLLSVAVAGASAATPGRGGNLFAIQLAEGTADLAVPGGTGVIASAHSELGLQVQHWHFFSDEYAMNLGFAVGTSRETDTPPAGIDPSIGNRNWTQTSWSARVGGDRVARVNDRFAVFAGPGLQVWRGRVKYESGDRFGGWTSQWTTRVGVEGRIGVWISWSERLGMVGQLGHYIAYASSAKDRGAQARWWPTGHDGAGGIAFRF